MSAGEREALERAGEEGRAREEARERRLASPGERAARERSRSAYRDLGDRAAQMAAREQLGVGRPRERPENIVQRLGDEVAVVQRENGERAVALSSVPLWTTDGAGREVPVDPSVQARDGGFGPVALVVDTRFGERVGDGVSLDDVVSFAPVVGDRTVEGEALGDKVYYANVGPDPDTDFMLAALPMGAEALWILRSPRAGEDHVLEFALAEDEVLELDDEVAGGAVVTRDGEVVSRIAPPSAVDGDGTVIDASYRVQGARLVVEVAHRGKDLRYPIEVDPAVIVYGLGPNGNPGVFHGWNPYEFNCGAIAFSPVNSSPQGLSMGAGSWAQGCYGRWRYYAPGSAYVFEMDLAGMFHGQGTGMGVIYGILNGDGSSPGGGTYTDGNDPPVNTQPAAEWWPLANVARRVCTTTFDNNGQLCPSSTGNVGNFAYFGLYNNASKYYPATQAAYVYGTTLYLGDRVAPARPTFSGIPASGWVRSPGSFQVASTQGGIGISAFTVNFPTGGYSSRVLPIACDRSYVAPYAPCRQSASTTIQVPAGASQGAAKSLSANASTYERGGYSTSRTVNIDGSGPEVDLSGPLEDNKVGPGDDAGNTLTESGYGLTVDATDGDPAGDNSARRSGVASIEIKVDGQRKHYVTQGCGTDSCPMSTSWSFVSDQYTQGEHTIEIVVTDRVGNTRKTTRHVRVDRRLGRLDHYGVDDHQLDASTSVAVNLGNGNLLAQSVDREYTDMSSFYAFERFYNSHATTAGPEGRGWSLARGASVRLQLGYDGAVGLRGPSGFVAFFREQPDGTYEAPQGLDQSLIANPDGTYKVDDLAADRQLLFDAAGVLTAELLPQGGRVDYAYDAGGRLASATDNLGRQATFSYDGAGYLDTMREHSGEVHRYDFDASGQLTAYTAPGEAPIGYTYAAGALTKITHRGGATSITYDTEGRVSAVIDGEASDASAPRSTYAYGAPTAPCDPTRDAGKTVVTDRADAATSYCYDGSLAITAQDPPPDARSVTPETEDQGPINPNAGTEYGCTPDPSGEPTYCGENPPEDPDNIGGLGGGLFGAQSASTDVAFGIADNNSFTRLGETQYMLFDSSAFQALEVRRVRRTIPWNIVRDKAAEYGDLYPDYVAWVQRALEDNYIPLLSIDRCRDTFPREGLTVPQLCSDVPPTRAEYVAAIREILTDPVLGQVNEFTAWNEPNNSGFQPTAEITDGEDGFKVSIEDATFENSDAVKAGTYWYDFWNLCQDDPKGFDCTVAVGDFLDSDLGEAANSDTPGYRYYRKYVKGMNNNLPERWAWHAYSDGELTLGYPDPSDWWRKFRSFARRTSYVGADERSPYIWLTEQGAVREDGGPPTRVRRDGPGTEGQRAQLVTNRMTRAVDRGLLGTSSRILRFYYYSMRGEFDSTKKAFDSGLLTEGRNLRGNYYSYRCRVANGATAGCP